jgi:hypothetical protein
MNDERLRRRLLAGDPGGENGLTPDEIHAMRRTVLTAAPEPRRRLLAPLALAGAAAVAVLIAFLALKPRPAEAPRPRIAAVAAPSAPNMAPPLAQPEPPRAKPAPRASGKTARAVHRRHHLRNRPEEAIAQASLKPAGIPEEPETRQIQFSTPGGTRIIWILKSGKASR